MRQWVDFVPFRVGNGGDFMSVLCHISVALKPHGWRTAFCNTCLVVGHAVGDDAALFGCQPPGSSRFSFSLTESVLPIAQATYLSVSHAVRKITVYGN